MRNEQCPKCGGKGIISEDTIFGDVIKDCPDCNGSMEDYFGKNEVITSVPVGLVPNINEEKRKEKKEDED